MTLAKINYANWLEGKLIEAVMLFLLWMVFYPLFLYYKNKIANLKIYSAVMLFRKSGELLNDVQIDSIYFDETNIHSLGKASLVSDLVSNELRLMQFSVYGYLDNLLNPDNYRFVKKLMYLWGMSQRDIITNIAFELESCFFVIDLSNKEILLKHLEVSRNEKLRYMKRYKETLDHSVDTDRVVLESKVKKLSLKYNQLLIPFRSLIIKNIIGKLNSNTGTDYLIQDIISEIIITYTIALRTVHYSINLWNGELTGISYKNIELSTKGETK